MLIGLFCLAIVLAMFLSWQDLRTHSISLVGLLGWIVVAVLLAWYGSPSLASFVVLLGISLCILAYQHWKQKMYIGLADLVMLTSLSAWVQVTQLPALFMLCGTLGLVTTIILKNKRFPFLPALFIATVIVYFL